MTYPPNGRQPGGFPQNGHQPPKKTGLVIGIVAAVVVVMAGVVALLLVTSG